MKVEPLEVSRGTTNIFRDFDVPNPDAKHLRARLASQIIALLTEQRLTVRAAEARTGTAAADFSRIRNADLGRFTIDRLIGILNKLGAQVDFEIKVVYKADKKTRAKPEVAAATEPTPRTRTRRTATPAQPTMTL
jgi:predicted XRE-type DNA-binding protein